MRPPKEGRRNEDGSNWQVRPRNRQGARSTWSGGLDDDPPSAVQLRTSVDVACRYVVASRALIEQAGAVHGATQPQLGLVRLGRFDSGVWTRPDGRVHQVPARLAPRGVRAAVSEWAGGRSGRTSYIQRFGKGADVS